MVAKITLQSEQKYLSSKRFIKNKKYWTEKFSKLPQELPRIKDTSLKGNRKSYNISKTKSIMIKEFM